MVEHTPGPWETSRDRLSGNHGLVGDGMWFAKISWTVRDNRNDADARLIAAAPDLLAVVRDACAIFDANHESGDEYNSDLASDLWKDEIHRKLTEAIAKAGGRS